MRKITHLILHKLFTSIVQCIHINWTVWEIILSLSTDINYITVMQRILTLYFARKRRAASILHRWRINAALLWRCKCSRHRHAWIWRCWLAIGHIIRHRIQIWNRTAAIPWLMCLLLLLLQKHENNNFCVKMGFEFSSRSSLSGLFHLPEWSY